ncbi:hypothetical protein [Virgibacillus sp. Bac330]|uniref:hypothetical protein n=1 Tax=Virgibacillus sp. Bac330 TaxID=2419841 RepID=UPI000EF44022|nr:hypothetical protein [Virgibacillus sp. Bac330]
MDFGNAVDVKVKTYENNTEKTFIHLQMVQYQSFHFVRVCKFTDKGDLTLFIKIMFILVFISVTLIITLNLQ